MVGELIGEGAAQEQTVVGETPNLAARLQTLAAARQRGHQPGDPTAGGRAVRAGRSRRRSGSRASPSRCSAWRVEGERRRRRPLRSAYGEQFSHPWSSARTRSRFCCAAGSGPRTARARWCCCGRAGSASRASCAPCANASATEPHIRLTHQCSPITRPARSTLLIGLLERACGSRATIRRRHSWPRSRPCWRAADRFDEVLPLIASLLGMPTVRATPRSSSPRSAKNGGRCSAARPSRGVSAEQPVLSLYEDVHWIDPTTLELLIWRSSASGSCRSCLLITFRPELVPPWSRQPHVNSLAVTRLGAQGRADGRSRAGREITAAEVIAQIVRKTDGVPLFVEELTKTVLESGLLTDAGDHYELSGPLPPLAIPTTLHASLMARLDRLAPVKEMAQIGAVIGREFSQELLAAVADLPEDQLSASLDELVASELIFRRGGPPERSTASNTRWSRTPPTSRCSNPDASSSMLALLGCSRSSSRRRPPPSRRSSPNTTRRRVWRSGSGLLAPCRAAGERALSQS